MQKYVASLKSRYDPTRQFRTIGLLVIVHVTVSGPKQRRVFHFYDLGYIASAHLYMYTYTADVCAREETKTEEETKEGHSIMWLSTTWPLTVQNEGCEEVREEGAPCALSLRSDAHPARYQTSHIDHVVGRRSFRYMR